MIKKHQNFSLKLKTWKNEKKTKLIISLLIPQLAGGIGSFFTASSVMSWFPTLEKPTLNPPSWVFAPVWTALFLLMGYSLFLVWTSDSKEGKKKAYGVFAFQLTLNVLWSLLFFGFKNPGLALMEIVFLWITIVLNVAVFSKISRTAAWFLAPYLLWVTFAAYLNFSIWRLN